MVLFVNCFEVEPGREDEFFALWQQVNIYMSAKPGYVSHRLHRSLAADATYRFINYVEWASPEHWRAAHDDGFRSLVNQPQWRAFPNTPALYEVVHTGGAAGDVSTAPAEPASQYSAVSAR
jgi:heme-degrading monooxygenase HmoA